MSQRSTNSSTMSTSFKPPSSLSWSLTAILLGLVTFQCLLPATVGAPYASYQSENQSPNLDDGEGGDDQAPSNGLHYQSQYAPINAAPGAPFDNYVPLNQGPIALAQSPASAMFALRMRSMPFHYSLNPFQLRSFLASRFNKNTDYLSKRMGSEFLGKRSSWAPLYTGNALDRPNQAHMKAAAAAAKSSDLIMSKKMGSEFLG